MTSSATFDYDQYVERFRAACARRGIDPARGANRYQVVHVIAERQQRSRRRDCWWLSHELWLMCPPYRSETEQEALWRLFVQAYLHTAEQFARAVRARRLLSGGSGTAPKAG